MAGANTESVLFDGHSVWAAVEEGAHGWVRKLGPTGRVVSSTPVGVAPLEMAYDGSRVWVTDYTSSDVTVVASNGNVVKSFLLPANAHPEGILFDGHYIWVANNGVGSSISNTVSKYDPGTLTLLANYPVGQNPDGAAFDGTYVWVTNSNSNTVVRLDQATGQILRTYPTGQFPLSIIFDGRSLWISNGADGDVDDQFMTGSVTQLRANGGINLGTFPVGNTVRGLAFDGSHIWICNSQSNSITLLRASDGARMGTYPAGLGPRSLAFDGERMWVADSGDNSVAVMASSREAVAAVIPPPPSLDNGLLILSSSTAVQELQPVQTAVDIAFGGPGAGRSAVSTVLGGIVGALLSD